MLFRSEKVFSGSKYPENVFFFNFGNGSTGGRVLATIVPGPVKVVTMASPDSRDATIDLEAKLIVYCILAVHATRKPLSIFRISPGCKTADTWVALISVAVSTEISLRSP